MRTWLRSARTSKRGVSARVTKPLRLTVPPPQVAAQGTDDGALTLQADGSLQITEAEGQPVVVEADILNIHGAVHQRAGRRAGQA